MTIGLASGVISAISYRALYKPLFNIDTRGVLSVHGIPGLVGGNIRSLLFKLKF